LKNNKLRTGYFLNYFHDQKTKITNIRQEKQKRKRVSNSLLAVVVSLLISAFLSSEQKR